MLKRIIEWSVANKLVVGLFTIGLAITGIIAIRRTPLRQRLDDPASTDATRDVTTTPSVCPDWMSSDAR